MTCGELSRGSFCNALQCGTANPLPFTELTLAFIEHNHVDCLMLLHVPAGIAALEKKQPCGMMVVPTLPNSRVDIRPRCPTRNKRKPTRVPAPDEEPAQPPKLKAQRAGARVQAPAPPPASALAPRELRDRSRVLPPTRFREVSTVPPEPNLERISRELCFSFC